MPIVSPFSSKRQVEIEFEAFLTRVNPEFATSKNAKRADGVYEEPC